MIKSLRIGAAALPVAFALLAALPSVNALAAPVAISATGIKANNSPFIVPYTFTIAGLSSLSGSVITTGLSSFGIALTGPSGFGTVNYTDANLALAGFQFGATPLSLVGTYTLTVNAVAANNGQNNSYSGSYLVTAVPEAATATMGLLVLSALGGLAWRRRSQ